MKNTMKKQTVKTKELIYDLQIKIKNCKEEIELFDKAKDEYKRMKIIIDDINDNVWDEHCNGIFWFNPIFNYDGVDDFYFSQFTKKRCCKVEPKHITMYFLNKDIDMCTTTIRCNHNDIKNFEKEIEQLKNNLK